MQVKDLSKQLKVTNKILISFLKEHGFKVSSHMQNLTDEEFDFVKAHEKEIKASAKKKEDDTKLDDGFTMPELEIPETQKVFNLDDLIPCKSVVPWKLNAVSMDKMAVYHWEYYGDIDYVKYRDLQALRRTDYITKPKIIIQDPDLCYQWRRELGDTYKYFLGVEYPEEFFDLSDEKFDALLRNAPDVIKEVIKTTAISMIKNENFPTVQKLNKIDDILGTCLKDFL